MPNFLPYLVKVRGFDYKQLYVDVARGGVGGGFGGVSFELIHTES